MPPAAQRVAHTSPSTEPLGPSHDPPASHHLGETTESAARRVSSEQIELINQLLARLQFARDAGDAAGMHSVLIDLDNQTGILELVIQRADERPPAISTDDPLAHARAVARKARLHESTARAQAEGVKAVEPGALSRLGGTAAPTSISETRRRAGALGEPGVCDDPTNRGHTPEACALTAPQRETTREMATTSLTEIASNWVNAITSAEITTSIAPLLEKAGPDPALGLLLSVGVSLAGLGVGSALVLAVETGGDAIKEVAMKVGESATEHLITPEFGPDADGAASPMFGRLKDAASAWKKSATREVRQLDDPQLVALAESIENHPYTNSYFMRALSSLMANYRQIAKIGQHAFGQIADEVELGLIVAPDGVPRLGMFRQEVQLHGETHVFVPSGRIEFVAWVDPALAEVAMSKVVMPEVLTQTDPRWVSAPKAPPRPVDVLKRPSTPMTTDRGRAPEPFA